ncbi:MAG: hypothetical protein K6E97_03885 [Treponema sp.]|nr:hypothetical protein [Treponema sp.]
MKLLVKKFVYEELVRPKIYISFNYGIVEKAFNSAVHPRDERGRFTYKGVMELSEQEREELLNYLENESYEPYKNFHVAKEKLDAFNKNGEYADEFRACEILAKEGYDIYLLDNEYVGGKKSDTFYKKPGKHGFMEIKDTSDKATTQYNRSVEQAESCFITISQDLTRLQFDNLKKAVAANIKADEVLIYYRKKVIRLK